MDRKKEPHQSFLILYVRSTAKIYQLWEPLQTRMEVKDREDAQACQKKVWGEDRTPKPNTNTQPRKTQILTLGDLNLTILSFPVIKDSRWQLPLSDMLVAVNYKILSKKSDHFTYPSALSCLWFRCRTVSCQLMCCRISLSAAMSASVISHHSLFPFILFMSLTAAAFDYGFR